MAAAVPLAGAEAKTEGPSPDESAEVAAIDAVQARAAAPERDNAVVAVANGAETIVADAIVLATARVDAHADNRTDDHRETFTDLELDFFRRADDLYLAVDETGADERPTKDVKPS